MFLQLAADARQLLKRQHVVFFFNLISWLKNYSQKGRFYCSYSIRVFYDLYIIIFVDYCLFYIVYVFFFLLLTLENVIVFYGDTEQITFAGRLWKVPSSSPVGATRSLLWELYFIWVFIIPVISYFNCLTLVMCKLINLIC